MNKIKELECRKCGNKEQIFIDFETNDGPGKYSRKNTFYCKDCDHLTTLDTVKERIFCKTCRSSNITKLFPENKVKCSTCGTQGFDVLNGINLD